MPTPLQAAVYHHSRALEAVIDDYEALATMRELSALRLAPRELLTRLAHVAPGSSIKTVLALAVVHEAMGPRWCPGPRRGDP